MAEHGGSSHTQLERGHRILTFSVQKSTHDPDDFCFCLTVLSVVVQCAATPNGGPMAINIAKRKFIAAIGGATAWPLWAHAAD